MSGTGFGNPLTIYRGLSGPPGPKPRKSLKKVSRGRSPGTPRESGKSLEKVWRVLFETFSRLSRLFPDFFQTLGGSLFSDFFVVSGPEGPRDPCKWSTGSQDWVGSKCCLCVFRVIPYVGVQETVLLVNHAFARGTPAIFVIFVVSRGLSSKALVLLFKMQLCHFLAVFVKNPPLFGGTKARFTKSTISWTPIMGRKTPERNLQNSGKQSRKHHMYVFFLQRFLSLPTHPGATPKFPFLEIWFKLQVQT